MAVNLNGNDLIVDTKELCPLLTPYHGLPLNPEGKETRLLHLQPWIASRESCGTLSTTSLDTRPVYEALSYTWGKHGRGQDIVLNQNHRLPITDNLYKA